MKDLESEVVMDKSLTLAIKQLRNAADNLYKAGESSGVRSASWKAARVCNSLSNSLEHGRDLYKNQLQYFLEEYEEAE